MTMTSRAGFVTLAVLLASAQGVFAAAPAVSLVDAVKRGDVKAARTLAGRGHVDARDLDGMTALHWAVQNDSVAMVELLLDAGADVGVANRYGVTPLSLASTNGDAAIMERLLIAGADPDTTVPGGETALMTAARTGRPETLKLLLAYGASVNAAEPTRGQTALMWAAAENNAAAVDALIDGGADVHARTIDRRPRSAGAFTQALAGQGGGDPYPASSAVGPTFTALLFAVQAGSLDATRVLLKRGANPNETLPDGTSALVLAAMNSNFELAAYLVDHGAAVDADRQGFTALHQIIRNRRTNIGLTPPPPPTGSLSALALVRKLLASGANPNARMTKDFRDGYRNKFVRIGATPFLLAAKNVDTEMMKVLLAGGADPTLLNADHTNALMVAAGVSMWNPGEDGGTEPGSEPEALEAVKMGFDLGHDINAANDRGETALHGAAYRGANSIVEFLVGKGAKLDAKTENGWVPWTLANGVFTSLFFKEQRATADLLARLMGERGLSTEGLAADPHECWDCARSRTDLTHTQGGRVLPSSAIKKPSAAEKK